MPLSRWTLSDSADLAGVLADSLTFGLGIFGLYTLIKNRKSLSLISGLLRRAYFSERASRINATLAKMLELTCDDKVERTEIVALVGQLCGQLQGLPSSHPEVVAASNAADELHRKRGKIVEADKRKCVELVRLALDVTLLQNDINLTNGK